MKRPALDWPSIIQRVEAAREERERRGLPGCTVVRIHEPFPPMEDKHPPVDVLAEVPASPILKLLTSDRD